jgi:hypothetical protein
MPDESAPADTQKIRPQTPESGRPPRKRRWRRRAVEATLGLLLAPIAVWLVVRATSGNQGLALVLDDEVAVHVDYVRGTRTIVSTPGYRPYVPWAQEVFRFDKSPNAFVMKGNVGVDHNHVPRLLVRANDGSSFWFDELTLQYAVMPDRAALVLEDSGPADAYKQQLVRAHARAILRDEFGRYSAEEVVTPGNLRDATQRSLDRLNAALNPHGIEVLEVSTPKPAFDKTYEEQIARRKVANQEVEHLRAELDQLAQVKIQREQAVRNSKEVEMRKLEGNLAADLSAAQTELIRAKSEADLVYQEKVGQGRMTKLEKETQAALSTAKNLALFDDAKKHTLAMEARGESAVRAALVEKLLGIEFDIVPYSRDPAPKRIEQETTTASVLGVKK